MRDETFGRGETCRLGILALVWLGVFVIAPAAPFAVVWRSFWPPVFCVIVLLAVWAVYRFARPDARLATTSLVAAEMTLFSVGGTLLNYMGFTFRRPFVDGSLAADDAAVGFDWPSYVDWVQSIPGADTLLTFAYQASLPQVVVIVLVLGFAARKAELDRFSIAFMVGAITTVLFWMAYPSYGAFTHRVGVGLAVPDHGLAINLAYARSLLRMQAGDFSPLRLGEMEGLIGFPSFHTVLALLSTWAVWRVRFVGPAVAALNVAVLAAIPGDGGHYVIDIAGGAAVTLLAIAVARAVVGPVPLRARESLSPAGS